MKLIDKDAVVAEIERRKKELIELSNDFTNQWACASLDNILSFLDTLEVKEVDLDEELRDFIMSYRNKETGYSIDTLAEHFFELGLKAQKGE